MSSRIEIGLRLPVAGPLASPTAIERVARRAEDLAFDALWVHDYLIWTRELDRTHISCGSAEAQTDDTPPVFHESLTTLAYVAGSTTKIRLGTAVLSAPYRNAIVAGRQLANVDALSGGRLIVGIGVGAPKFTKNLDFEVLGISRREKYDRTREALEAFEAMWTESLSSYQGKFVSFEEQEFFPKPAQGPKPPIWMAGKSDTGLDLVARYADGWLPTWLSPEDYLVKIDELYRRAADAGRSDDHRFEIGNEIVLCVDETTERARDTSLATVSTLTAGFTVAILDQALATSAIGSVDDIIATANRFAAVGVTHLEIKPIYHNVDHLLEQMETLSEKVFPHLSPPAQRPRA